MHTVIIFPQVFLSVALCCINGVNLWQCARPVPHVTLPTCTLQTNKQENRCYIWVAITPGTGTLMKL